MKLMDRYIECLGEVMETRRGWRAFTGLAALAVACNLLAMWGQWIAGNWFGFATQFVPLFGSAGMWLWVRRKRAQR